MLAVRNRLCFSVKARLYVVMHDTVTFKVNQLQEILYNLPILKLNVLKVNVPKFGEMYCT